MEENVIKPHLQEINCLNRRLCLKLPNDWKRASDEIITRKFPYSLKPQEIFMSPEGDRIFTLSALEKQLRENQIYSAIREIQRLISHMYPESILKSARGLRIYGGVSGWFSFVIGGLKGDILHYMFILPLENKMVLGSFHFPIETMEEDDKVFLYTLKSIRIVNDTEDTPENYERSRLHRQNDSGT